MLSALDRFGFGVAIALPSGEVIVANAEARRILEEADAIRQRPDGRLECAGADATARLSAAIAGASRTATGEGDLLEAPLRLERRSDADPVLLDVAPLRDGGGEIEPGLTGAVVYLMDMARPPPFDVARFARLHGLTEAEAEVCALLIEGERRAPDRREADDLGAYGARPGEGGAAEDRVREPRSALPAPGQDAAAGAMRGSVSKAGEGLADHGARGAP